MGASLVSSLEGNFFTYAGSLTTPPCSETVRWIVMETAQECSQGQVEAFKSLFPNPMSNRPLQRINGRTIKKNWDEGGDSLQFSGARCGLGSLSFIALVAALFGS